MGTGISIVLEKLQFFAQFCYYNESVVPTDYCPNDSDSSHQC